MITAIGENSKKFMKQGWHDPDMIWHGTNPLKTCTIQMQATTEKLSYWIFDAWWNKILQPQKWTFWEKEHKMSKRINNFTFNDYLLQCCS